MALDNSIDDCSLEFGRLLGYPTCCINAIADVNERNIDKYEKEVVSNWFFEKKFRLIDPKYYVEGSGYISHIPCCSSCTKSLEIALHIKEIVDSYIKLESFKQWL